MKIVKSFTVQRSPKEVFSFIAVNYFDNHQKFDPEIHGMINRSGGPVSQGTKGSEIRKVGGRRVSLDFEVTDFEANKYFAFTNTSGPVLLDRSYRFEPAGKGTKVTFEFEAAPRYAPVKLIFPMLKKSFSKNVDHNIKLLENLLNTGR